MPPLLKLYVVVILITGSTSSISGAAEVSCHKPVPNSLETVLAAKPRTFNGVTPYEEFVVHPAFEDMVKNTGDFILSSENKLLRRQILPHLEEMEIGLETITIRRDKREVAKKIPRKMKPFFTLLQAAILDQPIPAQDHIEYRLQVTPTGWNAEIMLQKKGAGQVSFSGCGATLLTIGLKLGNGQERIIRFAAQ